MTQPADLPDSIDPRRPVDRWLFSYAGDHQHPTNQLIHVICVPSILWAVTAFFWLIPVPAAFGRPGLWMAVAMFLAWAWYWRLSRPLAMGMLAVFVLFGLLDHWLFSALGRQGLAMLSIGVFIVAWVGQFIGHVIEGKRPSFFTDLAYLLVGPMWTLDKLYRRLGIGH